LEGGANWNEREWAKEGQTESGGGHPAFSEFGRRSRAGYATLEQVIVWVEQQWGVRYKVRGMHYLLKRLGFTYKKNRLVPKQQSLGGSPKL